MSDLALALRNLWRQRVRSGIALSAILFGVVALLLSGGFIEWVFFAMREATIESRFGHIQAVRPGYFRFGTADPYRYLLPEKSPELTNIEAVSEVRLVTPRIAFGGLVSFGETTVSFLGEGVDPAKEAIIGRQLHITHGEQLSSSDARGLILGEGLAMNLGVKIGDRVVLVTTTETGSINAVDAHVRGIFYTSSKVFDDVALRTPIRMAQSLLRTTGTHVWVVLLESTDKTDVTLTKLKAQLPTNKSGLEFVSWKELDEFYNRTVTLFSRQLNVVRIILAVIIVLSVSNTLTMTVLERTNEIGTLMAIGLKKRKILRIFIAEGFVLGLSGGVIGVIIGLVLAWIISSIGIPMPPPPGMQRGFIGEIRVTSTLAINSFAFAAISAAAASIYPAWKASRLLIVDALRHSR
jgi:putative ABC transport system permease protein